MMEMLSSPIGLFSSRNKRNDYRADDMFCGDLTTEDCIKKYNLRDISVHLNPYTRQRIGALANTPLPKDEVNRILFNEFRELSKLYAFYGPYKEIIIRLIDHMQENSGRPYESSLLNSAFRELILDEQGEKSMYQAIKKELVDNFRDLNRQRINSLKGEIMDRRMPMFARKIDAFNGMGISIHQIHSVNITLESVKISAQRFNAILKFRAQDHFGLDERDIIHPFYKQFRIFRIWFILQRHRDYAFKPFLTNMDATIHVNEQ
ncbi:MAG: DUF3289 family protein [Pantoea sp.]|uniref:YPO3983 family protein n=1 Tax=Pantoea sp. TaxID=69393 RepID=UPI0023912B84|nr:DUF3289 family protein [Pantoea sp.]MDE1185343.1 DUF3289 family protein [Pantoea sp.]